MKSIKRLTYKLTYQKKTMQTCLRNIMLRLTFLFGISHSIMAQCPNNRANIVVRNATDNVTNPAIESLRWAIQQANCSTQRDVTITFEFSAPKTTIILNSFIAIQRQDRADGQLPTITIIGADRILLIGTGARTTNGFVINSVGESYISALEFQNFSSALSASSSIDVSNCVFTNNTTGVFSLNSAKIRGSFIGTNKTFTPNIGNDVNLNLFGGMEISGNYICSAKNDAIKGSASGYIYDNNIGISLTSGLGNKGNAINMSGINNHVALSNNTFAGNGGGISTNRSELRNNIFFCNAGTVFASTIPYPKPVVTRLSYSETGIVTISGTSNAVDDYIEIYESISDPSCPTVTCQGLSRFNFNTTTNASKLWTKTFTPTVGAKIFVSASRPGTRQPVIEGSTSEGSTSLLTDCRVPDCPNLVVTLQKLTDVNCFGNSDGRARLSVAPTGAGGLYQYQTIQTDVTPNVTSAAKGITNFDTIKTLKSGRFKVLVTNTITGCPYNSPNEITITQPNAPLSITNCRQLTPASSGFNNGTGEVRISGGSPPYTLSYYFNGFNITLPTSNDSLKILPNLGVGTYYIGVIDSKYALASFGTPQAGCSATCVFTISSPVCTISASIVSTTPNPCFDDSSGSVKVKYSDILSNFPIVLKLGNDSTIINSFSSDSTFTFSKLKANRYILRLRNNANCEITRFVEITQPPKLHILCDSVNHVKNSGQAEGIAHLKVSNGGAPPYRIVISGRKDTTIIMPSLNVPFRVDKLPAGQYVATLTDGTSGPTCNDTCQFTIKESACANMELSIKALQNVRCFGQNNGSTTLKYKNSGVGGFPMVISLGNFSANILQYSADSTVTFPSLIAGNYKSYFTDNNGCVMTIDLTIIQPDSIRHIPLAIRAPLTEGGSDGGFVVQVTGGTRPYVVTIDSIKATINSTGAIHTFNALKAGTYTYQVRDSNGCIARRAVIIPAFVCKLGVNAVITPTSCNDGTNGQITLSPSNSTGNIIYNWTPSVSTTNIASNLMGRLYSVTISDSTNCKIDTSFRVSAPPTLIATYNKISDVTTNQGNQGSFSITVQGGTPAYRVSTKLNQTIITPTRNVGNTFFFENLIKGTYIGIVTDANNCPIAEQSITITEPICSLRLTKTIEQIRCQGERNGSIILNVTGSSSTVTYKWDDSSTRTTATATGLDPKMYKFTITDGQNCSISDSARITEPLKLTSTFRSDSTKTVGGQDGSIQVTVRGGIKPYTVRFITENVLAQKLTDSTFIFRNLTAKTYTYEVIDSNDCKTLPQTVVVNAPACNLSFTPSVENVKCNGASTGSILLTVVGGTNPLRFEWSDPSVLNTNFASQLTARTYSATIKDNKNCSITTQDIRIIEPAKIILDTFITNVRVRGQATGSIRIGVRGGVTPYTVRMINPNPNLTATRLKVDSFVFNNLPKGTYTYSVSDFNNCEQTQIVTINDPDCAVTSQVSISRPISCFGLADGAIALTVQNARNPRFSWSGGLGTVQSPINVRAGTYTVSIIDDAACTDTKQITLSQPPQISATIAGDTAICNGQTARLRFTVANAITFSLVFSNGTTNATATITQAFVNPIANTTFRLVSVQSGTCTGIVSGTATVQVTLLPTPTGIQANKDSLCAGSNLTINVTPAVLAGVQYIWQTPIGTVTTQVPTLPISNVNANNSGQYSVRTSQNGCLSAFSTAIPVTVIPITVETAFAGRDKVECGNTSTTLAANPTLGRTITGRWLSLDGATVAQISSNTPSVSGLKTGNNRFVWILSNSVCGDISPPDTVVVFVEKKPVLTEATFNLEGSGSSIIINMKELLKDTSAFNLTLSNPVNGAAQVQNGRLIVFDRTNIKDAQSIDIPYRVCNAVCPTLCENSRLIINVTPFEQGNSEKLKPIVVINDRSVSSLIIDAADLIENNECVIMDRWGTPLFGPQKYINNSPKDAWDITRKGKTLPNGAYYYMIIDKDKKIKQPLKGIIYLVDGL
jgi:hypothetical protein